VRNRLDRLSWVLAPLLILPALLAPLSPSRSSAGEAPVANPAAAPLDLPARFQTYESMHFLVHSDASAEWTRGRIALLERTAHQVRRLTRQLGLVYERPEHKLVCVLFEHYEEYAEFARRVDGMSTPWVAGYYAGRANRIVYYNDETGPAVRQAGAHLASARRQLELLKEREVQASRERDQQAVDFYAAQRTQLETQLRHEESRLERLVSAASDAKAIHEASHLLAFNTGLQSRYHQYPFWFTEGLATCFETDAPNAAFGPDFEYEPRRARFQELLAGHELLPLRAFVGLVDISNVSAERADVLYHQAYSLLVYLHRYKRGELRRYLQSIAAEPPGAIDPARQIELFEASFGSIEALERRWLAHENQR
jgi:hypothetical protein